MSTANPARLTRAEFRVCLMLSEGMDAAELCAELMILPSTFKAHLRSILVKTGLPSLAELLACLPSPSESARGSSEPLARQA